MIELNTVKGLMRYQCRPDVTIPLKRKDEVYLIFPYCMVANEIIEPNKLTNKIQVFPLWDILIVPNFLLDEPIDSPLYY